MTSHGCSWSWEAAAIPVIDEVRRLMGGLHSSHSIDHVMRVRLMALRIAGEEHADPAIVEAAALLHDVGRAAEEQSPGTLCHAREGARMAGEILEGRGAPSSFVSAVQHCVASHRFRGTEAPATPEARALFDADKLDAIGALGLGRAFLFAGEVGARLYNPEVDPENQPDRGPEDSALREFLVKLRHVRDRMLTGTGRALAEERHAFMERFFEQMDAEARGLR